MLQGVRDNLKGTIAVVVILLFVIPMVLSGVGGSILGSAAGTDAATVDGESISKMEVSREVYAQKQRILSQGDVDPSADFLKDENLRGPVLNRLTRRTALFVEGKDGGMGVSDQTIDKIIIDQEQFYVDGKFDGQIFRQLLMNNGYTPASYRDMLKTEILVEQQTKGIINSGFITEAEINSLVAVIDEARSIITVKIPAENLKLDVSVNDTEIAEYYESNQQEFIEPEKASVKYLELSVAGLANDVVVSEEEIKAQFDQELKDFAEETEYQIAHLLISEENKQNVKTVVDRLASGEDFETLVKEFSEDEGTKDANGQLGVLTPGIYPDPFEKAVYALAEGEVSPPVETDAGTHFIKAVKKTTTTAPNYEDRKVAIENALKRAEAESLYVTLLDKLGEYTFNAKDLSAAAAELNLKVKESPAFGRERGAGIATNASVRQAAYSQEVLVDGQNSNVVEIGNDRAVVLRINTHEAEHVKSLDFVREAVVANITKQKLEKQLNERAEALIAKLKTGEQPEQLAEELGYEYKEYNDVKRSDAAVDRSVLTEAFSMAKDKKYATVTLDNSDHVVIELLKVQPGSTEDLAEQRLNGLMAQLNRENTNYENSAYEAQVVGTAKIKIH